MGHYARVHPFYSYRIENIGVQITLYINARTHDIYVYNISRHFCTCCTCDTYYLYIWVRHTRMCIYLTHIINYTDIQCICNIAQTLRLSIVSRRLRVCSKRVVVRVFTYFWTHLLFYTDATVNETLQRVQPHLRNYVYYRHF